MAALARIAPRHDDLVTFTGTDVVVAARAPVRLLGLVRLHVADVDVVGVVSVVGPAVVGHGIAQAKKTQTSSASTTKSAAPTKT